jgi:isoleucyl-tRNA synthetase
VLLKDHVEELPMLFIVSDVELRPIDAADLQVTIEKAAGVKCERCWRYVPTVSTEPSRPGICDRCQDALAEAVSS